MRREYIGLEQSV